MKSRSAGVPDWARDAIWYQVFPERFRNGLRKNDPRISDITERRIPGWRISPWGQDWYSQEPWEKRLGGFFKSVYLRRFGGDLAGVREKLDYLQDLGVNAIYLNPIFQAPSLHKYDASSLHHVDPTFGPDRDGDVRKLARAKETEDPTTWIWTSADRCLVDLVGEIHRRGMRVILDGVFNHTGRGFFAFRDLLAKGRNSRYRDWYKIKRWKPDGTFEYDGWFGHQMLPEFAQKRDSLARPVRDYIFNITKRWMDPDGDGDPSDGVDGWRLDVAFCIPHGFWKQWRRLVKGINPEAYLTAEIVTLATDYLKGDEFDAVMNYMWLFAAVSFFTPHPRAIPAGEFRKRLDQIRKAYPPDAGYVLQNLLDSHDVGRILTVLENRFPPVEQFGEYFECTRAKDRPYLVTTKPGRRALDSLRQMAVFQAAYVGAPMIYYGTEVGLWGANDPCDRQPMLWDDISASPESNTLAGGCRANARSPNRDLFLFFKRVFAIRRDRIALRRGALKWIETANERLIAFERVWKGDRILVVLNANDAKAAFRLDYDGYDLWQRRAVTRGNKTILPRGWLVMDVGG
jgi:glycosidase